MKKTLMSLLFAAGIPFACGTDFTTVTGSVTGTTGVGTYYGWTVKLTDTFLSTTPVDESFSDLSVTLDSLDLSLGTGSSVDNVKVAVYKYAGDHTVGEFVGLSVNDSGTWSASSTVNLQFEGVTLSTNQQYQFLFVTSDATVESLTDTSTEGSTLLSVYQSYSTGLRLSVNQQSGIPSGDGTYTGNGINSWEGQYIPNVTYHTSTASVPEPATASLSLLALGALALRRRRA